MKRLLFVTIATLTLITGTACSQLVPVPSDEAKTPNRLRFTKDGSAVVFFPTSPKGPPIIIPLHNQIRVALRVTVRQAGDEFTYTYAIKTLEHSPDLMTGFGLIVNPTDDSCKVLREQSKWQFGACEQKPSPIAKLDLLGGGQGKWVQWDSPDGNGMPRGNRISLSVVSRYKPGLVVAYLDNVHSPMFPPDFDVDSLTDEETNLLTLARITKHVVSIGPRYAPGTPQKQVAADIYSELRTALELRAVPTSPWILRTLNTLQRIGAGGDVDITGLKTTATTPFEQDFADALRITFARP